MKTRSLTAAMLVVAMAGPAHAAFFGVGMNGDAPFCVYEVSWTLEGVALKRDFPVRKKMCTPDGPRPADGKFFRSADGSLQFSGADATGLTMQFKRAESGEFTTVRFGFEGQLIPRDHGWRLSSFEPFITPDGVYLRAVDIYWPKGEQYPKFRDRILSEPSVTN